MSGDYILVCMPRADWKRGEALNCWEVNVDVPECVERLRNGTADEGHRDDTADCLDWLATAPLAALQEVDAVTFADVLPLLRLRVEARRVDALAAFTQEAEALRTLVAKLTDAQREEVER